MASPLGVCSTKAPTQEGHLRSLSSEGKGDWLPLSLAKLDQENQAERLQDVI